MQAVKAELHEVEESDSIRLYLDDINRTPLLSFEEEKELSRRIQQGDKIALERMIRANLRLVVKIAKQYVTRDYSLLDVIQDGNLGLIKAAEKYDHGKEVRFSTYASWWIKQSIVRSPSLKKRMIRIPHRKEEKLRHIRKAWNELNQQLKRAPLPEEIAHVLGLPVEEVLDILSIANPVVSFETSTPNDENGLLSVLGDSSYSPDEMVIERGLREETRRILASLVPKERKVLARRFGFDTTKRYTLKLMGDEFGISAETVRQIEMKALKKLRERYSHMREYLCQ